MTVVTKTDVVDALHNLGIRESDCVLVHSSMKSVGYMEGGPDAVIDGFLEVLADGTLVFPTLCSRDWEHVYENWHMDAESDVGLLTNIFRKRQGALRSNQATHSVAAIGKEAEYLTRTHGEDGKRIGIYGDTPFSTDSPWEKMYQMNSKVVFWGVTAHFCTLRHLAEYIFVDQCLTDLEGKSEHEEFLDALWLYGGENKVWPHVRSLNVYEELRRMGAVKETTCGDAKILCIEAKPFVDFCIKVLEDANTDFIVNMTVYQYQETLEWLKRLKDLRNK